MRCRGEGRYVVERRFEVNRRLIALKVFRTFLYWMFGVSIRASVSALLLCVAQAETLQILETDAQSFQCREDLIAQATSEIYISSYQISDEDIPLYFLGLLRDAARRGVDVRVLVDGHRDSNLIPKAMMTHLIREGVQIEEFHPDIRYRPELGRSRLHDKLLIVDQRSLLIGGRNLCNSFFGAACHNYVDRDVLIVGTLASQARSYFLSRWASCDTGTPSLQRNEAKKVVQAQSHPELNSGMDPVCRSAALLDATLEQGPPSLAPSDCARLTFVNSDDQKEDCIGAYEIDNVCFWHDVVDGSKHDPRGIANQYLQLLSQAKRSILIETPYFVVTPEMKRTLADARKRGVRVCIVTNSLESNDHALVHAGYANQRHGMRMIGVELWEWQGKSTLHAKLTVVDGKTTVIGSYNADVLSENRNSEVAVVIKDPAVAAEFTCLAEQHLLNAKHVPSNGLLLGFDAQGSHVSSERLAKFRRMRLIAPICRPFL